MYDSHMLCILLGNSKDIPGVIPLLFPAPELCDSKNRGTWHQISLLNSYGGTSLVMTESGLDSPQAFKISNFHKTPFHPEKVYPLGSRS
jgi:hypothetical protein